MGTYNVDNNFQGLPNLDSTTNSSILRVSVPIPILAAAADMPTINSCFVMEGGANIMGIKFTCTTDVAAPAVPAITPLPTLNTAGALFSISVIPEYATGATPPAATSIATITSGNLGTYADVTAVALPYTPANNKNYRIFITPTTPTTVAAYAAATNLNLYITYIGAH